MRSSVKIEDELVFVFFFESFWKLYRLLEDSFIKELHHQHSLHHLLLTPAVRQCWLLVYAVKNQLYRVRVFFSAFWEWYWYLQNLENQRQFYQVGNVIIHNKTSLTCINQVHLLILIHIFILKVKHLKLTSCESTVAFCYQTGSLNCQNIMYVFLFHMTLN